MIEMELRGRLSDQEFDRLTSFLQKEGELLESQDREMILLRGYPGYSHDPIVRDTDIRLRNTNGNCEIMVKRKVTDGNVSRHETSLKLKDSTLDTVKNVIKAFGFNEGLWMHRKKDIYRYHDIEWSIVDVPGFRYFEAEKILEKKEDFEHVRAEVEKEAKELGLTVMTPEEVRDFIYELDKAVNKDISW